MRSKKIGEFLVEKGIIGEKEVAQILNYSRQSGKRFCEAGLDLHFITREKLIAVFAPGYEGQFFHMDAQHLKRWETEMISIDDIVRYGIIPLGLKKESRLLRKSRRNNLVLGMLDPSKSATTIKACRAHLTDSSKKRRLDEPSVYLVLIDQFLDVLETVYGVTATDLARYGSEAVFPLLADFLHLQPRRQSRAG